MALAKVKSNKKAYKIIIIGLLLASTVGNIALLALLGKNNIELTKATESLKKEKAITKELKGDIKDLKETIKELEIKLEHQLNSESDIRVIREDIIKKIKETVTDRKRNIQELDILRALNSTENRVMDEYIRVAALILATMEVESNFKYISCTNDNGTVDHGIMQVNDAIIPHAKASLGDDIDPINNRNDNVEAGSWEIYECYLRAKEKHPENTIWWTYVYYNRGMYVESTDAWKNPKNPNHKNVREQANVRSTKFKESFDAYYEALSSIE